MCYILGWITKFIFKIFLEIFFNISNYNYEKNNSYICGIDVS